MTPRELKLHVEEYNERTKREHELAVIQAYHTARFYRIKKMPSLKRVLESMQDKKPQKTQSPVEMLAFAKQFTEQFLKAKGRGE